MSAVWFNRRVKDDEERRTGLYSGEVFVYDNLRSVAEFVSFTRELVEEALSPNDPRRIHEVLTPEELAPVLGRLKPLFTHHPEARRGVIRILEELGVNLDDCHLDVPKLRTAYPTGHLTKGIAYAFQAHRDTWYGGPQAQVNWWLPIYPLHADNAMAFYPRYFSQPVTNDSSRFNYYRRNVERRDVSKFVREDPRLQPSAVDVSAQEPEFRLLPEVGGLIMFSGAQLHATVSNPMALSRYSVDFRSVSRRDVERGVGAPNVDSRCVGTALRDFKQASTGTSIPEAVALLLDPIGPGEGEIAVFEIDAPDHNI